VRNLGDRLRMAFAAHLAACARFYDRDVSNVSSDAEIDVILRSPVDFPAPQGKATTDRLPPPAAVRRRVSLPRGLDESQIEQKRWESGNVGLQCNRVRISRFLTCRPRMFHGSHQ